MVGHAKQVHFDGVKIPAAAAAASAAATTEHPRIAYCRKQQRERTPLFRLCTHIYFTPQSHKTTRRKHTPPRRRRKIRLSENETAQPLTARTSNVNVIYKHCIHVYVYACICTYAYVYVYYVYVYVYVYACIRIRRCVCITCIYPYPTNPLGSRDLMKKP